MLTRHAREGIRFDTTSSAFASLAEAYDVAVRRADRLLRRIEHAEEDGEFSYAKKLGRKLAAAFQAPRLGLRPGEEAPLAGS